MKDNKAVANKYISAQINSYKVSLIDEPAYSKNSMDTAMDSINRAIEYDSTSNHHYELRGKIYFDQLKYSLAYKDFQKAVEINPKSVNAWNLMGLINFFRGN